MILFALGIESWGPTEWGEGLIALSLVLGAIWQASAANTKLATLINEVRQQGKDIRELRKLKDGLLARVIRLEARVGLRHFDEEMMEDTNGNDNGNE